jgi:DUF1680 family protein
LSYFLPLRAGGRKAWASETEDFFCCHGTLVQANASLDRGIYYQSTEDPSLAVAQFFNSSLETSVSGIPVKLSQQIDTLTGMKNFTGSDTGMQALIKSPTAYPRNPGILRTTISIDAEKPAGFTLRVRVPWWIKAEPLLYINGEKTAPLILEGWVSIERTWRRDTVVLELKRGISAWPLPGAKNTMAFLYGPVVLAGLCEEEIRLDGDPAKPEEIIAADNEREWGVWMDSFKTCGQAKNIRLIPLYRVGYEAYTIYFPIGK